jgi:exopolysaccharide biosynthesis polyprenyl glycosylphosphotransferase
MNLAGSAAIVAYFSHMLIARTFIAIVIPVGACLQLLARFAIRRAVYARRARGEWTSAILAVGTSESVRHLIETTRRTPFAGLVVIGACVEDAEPNTDLVRGVPVLGDVRHASAIAEQVDADIVAVAGSGLGPQSIRQLGWDLEGTGRNMVMAPGLTDVAGPRVHVSPVEGLPLMWVDQPQFTGLARVAKRGMDVVCATLLVLVASPVLFLLGALVRLTSPGPALYRSVRTGANGKLITVYKFRSMYVDADRRRASLVDFNEVEGGVIFKMRADPRVTPVGRILRKFSLDELPQLLNVLRGEMSVVGPRPEQPEFVERLEGSLPHYSRRHLIKPGLTGWAQVRCGYAGSDIGSTWKVCHDLYYLKHRSLALNLVILGETLRTLVADPQYAGEPSNVAFILAPTRNALDDAGPVATNPSVS